MNKSEYRFNLEVFRDGHSKEVKLVNFPLDKLAEVANDLKEKYC